MERDSSYIQFQIQQNELKTAVFSQKRNGPTSGWAKPLQH